MCRFAAVKTVFEAIEVWAKGPVIAATVIQEKIGMAITSAIGNFAFCLTIVSVTGWTECDRTHPERIFGFIGRILYG